MLPSKDVKNSAGIPERAVMQQPRRLILYSPGTAAHGVS